MNKSVSSKRSERTKHAGFASPSLQPPSEAFAVPLPPDFEDEGLLMPANMTEGKPDYEQKELKKQCYGQQHKAAEHTLYNQYEEKIRPCIDLIDSLRALGIEKDLALPAIAVIGDQSSGKSSVLEALSGIALPRGNGIVTRCPLELKLKRIPAAQAWKGKMCYRNTSVELQDASEVEKAIREAQNVVAGTKGAISAELISLEISSPDVPDLTLIDLPGIARVAVGDQPKDVGAQDMAAAIVFVLALLALQRTPTSNHHLDVSTAERMQQRQEYLHQQMTLLLQEIERSDNVDEAMVLSLWRQWPVWTPAAALLLLASVCWTARKMKLASPRCKEHDTSSREKEDKEEEEDFSGAHHRVSSSAAFAPPPPRGILSP
ncbi:interferon-induced GTP-binding protein Mx-like [Pluvialis apricaria]